MMRLIVGIVVLLVLAGGGYFGYKKFVKNEDVTIESALAEVKSVDLPDVDVEMDPYNKGVALQRTTKYEDAIAEFRKVITAKADAEKVEHAHFRIAQCYASAKKYSEAIKSYKFAIKQYPKSEHTEKAQKALDRLELERG